MVVDLVGVGWWATARDPLPAFTPLRLGLGLSHRQGEARLGGRLGAFVNPGDEKVVFLYGEMLSLEQVFRAETRLRPYWRLAVGFGLDLRGPKRSLGDDRYFNPDNGAAGGLSLGHGWGLDAFVSESVFLRVEVNGRIHGGAGRVGVLFDAAGGTGCVF